MTPSPTQKQNPNPNPKVHDFKSRFGVVPDSPPPKLTRLQARRAKRKRVRMGMIAFSVMLGVAGGSAFLIAQDFESFASFFKPAATNRTQTAEAPSPSPPPSVPLNKTTTEESPVLLPQAATPPSAPAAPAPAPTPPASVATAPPPQPVAPPVTVPTPPVAVAPPVAEAPPVTPDPEPETSAIAEAPAVEPPVVDTPDPAPVTAPQPAEAAAAPAQPVPAAPPPQPFVPKVVTADVPYPSPPVIAADGTNQNVPIQQQEQSTASDTQMETVAQSEVPVAPQVAPQVAMAAPATAQDAPVVKPSGGAPMVQGQVFRDCENCPDLVVVLPPQGLPQAQIARAKIPAGAEPLKPYAIGRFEVTFDDWARCMAGGGCTSEPEDAGWGRNTRPVINVSHDDAVKQYITWLSGVTGAQYRLPSTIEWDFAEEGGGVVPASGVPLIDNQTICQSGNYVSGQASGPQEASCSDGFPTTAPAGSFKGNALGLHDMRGNVWEWVSDCWTPGFTFRVKDSERDCRKRLLRGGSWSSRAALSATPARGFDMATRASKSIGFRVARTLP
ncbi:MAG: SUMF1/EgtB/PvdO family nonheme iron enzyme [Rhizobiales bacterium]|nr:SUMF1/EgtB/PvdO family nonheme iron enzyme [Hyphomicrobiales bacterium]